MTRKLAAERMHLLRKKNVKRHNDFAAKVRLEAEQKHAQKVATMQMELDMLHSSTVRGSG
jgi:hypothetical protein